MNEKLNCGIRSWGQRQEQEQEQQQHQQQQKQQQQLAQLPQ